MYSVTCIKHKRRRSKPSTHIGYLPTISFIIISYSMITRRPACNSESSPLYKGLNSSVLLLVHVITGPAQAKIYWSGHLLININECIKIASLGTPTTAVRIATNCSTSAVLYSQLCGKIKIVRGHCLRHAAWKVPRSLKTGTAKTVLAVPCVPALRRMCCQALHGRDDKMVAVLNSYV